MELTVGKLLVNDVLPPGLRDYTNAWDASNIKNIMTKVAVEHSDKYHEILNKLLDLGKDISYFEGETISISDMELSPALVKYRKKIEEEVNKIIENSKIPLAEKTELLVNKLQKLRALPSKYITEASPNFKHQLLSGSRGNPATWQRLIFGDVVYTDQWDRPAPVPVLRGYGEGLYPVQHFMATFSARKGLINTNLGTGTSGWLSKILSQASHDLLITKIDGPRKGINRGLPADINSSSLEGVLLAAPAGGFGKDTVLTPRIIATLKAKGIKKLLIRSPIIAGDTNGGLFAKDLGIRETGKLADVGDLPGLTVTQAVGERITQSSLSSKHAGGRGHQSAVEQLLKIFEMPKVFVTYTRHADVVGKVEKIIQDPEKGYTVIISGKKYTLPVELKPVVKVGDTVEPGDPISDGLLNIRALVDAKHIGEGRRVFVDMLYDFFREIGLNTNRRNLEVLARAAIRYVKFGTSWDGYEPDDIEEYDVLEHKWIPRKDSIKINVNAALDKYLEEPVLHYTIGTKITPRVINTLKEFGVTTVTVNSNAPPFSPELVRLSDVVGNNPDWFVRLSGSYLKRNLLNALYKGLESTQAGRSYIPALAAGKPFGSVWPPKG